MTYSYMGYKTESSEPTNKETHRYRQQKGGYQREKGWEEDEQLEGVKYMVAKEDQTLNDEDTKQYIDDTESHT